MIVILLSQTPLDILTALAPSLPAQHINPSTFIFKKKKTASFGPFK
jgi:hypothetical protein